MQSAEPSLFSVYLPLIKQIMRFGIVGLTAATVHFTTVVLFVQYAGLHPLVANAFAFLVSFQVSYFGHRTWTFSGTAALHRVALPKLVLVQVCAFIANESLFYVFLQMHLPYQVALLIVLSILPIFTFLLSRFWVFK
jgi:putative flippase GtrA